MSEKIEETIAQHLVANRVKINPHQRKCIDGGYHPDEQPGGIAIPGADLGLSMVLIQVGFDPHQAFDIVYDYVVGLGDQYCWHTDDHDHSTEASPVGCGHCNESIIAGSSHYEVDGKKYAHLLRIVEQKQIISDPNLSCVVLHREHHEQAILVNSGKDYTVLPWDTENDVQFFVYDQTHHQRLLQEIAKRPALIEKKVSYDRLWEVAQSQADATLGLLGSSRGKEIYSVDMDDDLKDFMVQRVGVAPEYDHLNT